MIALVSTTATLISEASSPSVAGCSSEGSSLVTGTYTAVGGRRTTACGLCFAVYHSHHGANVVTLAESHVMVFIMEKKKKMINNDY